MRKKWLWHFLFWILYLALEVYTEFYWMRLQYQQSVWSTFSHAFAEELLTILLLKVPMVYLMFFTLKKYGQAVRNRWKLVLTLIFLLLFFSAAGYLFLMDFIVPVVYAHMEIQGLGGFGTLLNSFMDKIFIACVAIALNEYVNSQQLKQREQLLLSEKTQNELLFLKSQINPHFLFNTLNNIYALARKKSDETPQVVLQLSKLLRYVLYETEAASTLIPKEIDFIKDYVDLQKIRFDDRLRVHFKVAIDDEEFKIVPLLLIPLVENAFKHGASQSTKNSFIDIDLNLNFGCLIFSVENSFEPDFIEPDSGIGLRNLRRQLELSYSDYHLRTEEKGTIFFAELRIDLKKNL